jgi:hypothetical protein
LLAFAELSTDEKRREKDEEASEERNEEEKRGGHDISLIARHFLLSIPPFCYYSSNVRLIVSHAQAYDLMAYFFPFSCYYSPHPSIVSTMRITATV